MPTPPSGHLFYRPATAVRGDSILPLNLLRETYPDLYERHQAKHGRHPSAVTQVVEPLGCSWGDVVFFSPVHPAPLCQALRRAGKNAADANPWVLPAQRLAPDRTVIRLMRAGPDGHTASPAGPDDYLPFTSAGLRAVNRVSFEAIQRLESLGPDDPWMPWVDVPHVLYRGAVPVDWFTATPD